MSSGELIGGFTPEETEMSVPLRVDVITLGPGNVGTFGPTGLDKTEQQQIIQSLGSPEVSRRSSNRWECVDGRTCREAMSQPDDGEIANPQIGGSLPVSESAASYMDDPAKHRKLSETVGTKTQEAIADGLVVVLHGDDLKGKGGCAANAKMRDILHFNAENTDIVEPQVWQICKALSLDKWITQDDIVTSIINGKTAADNDELWDASPEQVVDIAVANGAEYQELEGPHQEVTLRADLTDGAFAKVPFIREQSTATRVVQAFSASFGKYKAESFRRAELHGRSEAEAALQTMRVKAFNVGLTKMLKNDEMEVGVVSRA